MTRTKLSLGVIAVTAATALTLFCLPFTPRLAVRTAVIRRGDLVLSVCLEGAVTYREQTPALSPQAGMLKAVHVREGQRVQAGQLLFQLDTSVEEQALAALAAGRYARQQALTGYGAAALALGGETLEWEEKELALRQAIAAKQLRAAENGLVEAVYAKAGDAVAAGALLGMVRGDELCVTAACQAGSAEPVGSAALITLGGESPVPARLEAVTAPEGETGSVQRLCFVPLGDASEWKNGQRAMVEIVRDVDGDVPLAPLEAFDSGNRLWVVRDDAAVPVPVDTTRRSGAFVCVPESLLGERVILLPEESDLTPGRAVKEAKAR